MNISLSTYNALYEFLLEFYPDLAEEFAESAQGDYDFVLEQLNIRQRGQVEIDESLFKNKKEEFIEIAKKNLEEWEEEEYISHIDQKIIDTYQLSLDFFEEI